MAILRDKKHKCWYIDVKIKLDDGTRYHTSYKDTKNSNLKSKTYAKALDVHKKWSTKIFCNKLPLL